MTPLPPITATLLESNGACASQVKLFREHFGEGPAPLDDETAKRMAQVFDWEWAALHLLPTPLWEEYNAKHATLWAKYNAKNATLWEEYRTKYALLFVALYREGAAL